ncbi:MAG: hypothetical protein U0Q16_05855 [Bryobacteraceae bacterium]
MVPDELELEEREELLPLAVPLLMRVELALTLLRPPDAPPAAALPDALEPDESVADAPELAPAEEAAPEPLPESPPADELRVVDPPPLDDIRVLELKLNPSRPNPLRLPRSCGTRSEEYRSAPVVPVKRRLATSFPPCTV